jgi:hypothetical protein
MDRQKTVGPPLILRDVVPESGEGRPREQHISSTIEQIVECSTHPVQRASRVEGGEEKVEVRANVDLLVMIAKESSDVGRRYVYRCERNVGVDNT